MFVLSNFQAANAQSIADWPWMGWESRIIPNPMNPGRWKTEVDGMLLRLLCSHVPATSPHSSDILTILVLLSV